MTTGYVYKLCCTDIKVTEVYVGSTKSLRNRRASHKSKCNGANEQPKLYDYINANGGWDNWSMIVVETLQYNEKHELRARERFWMESLKASLNVLVPSRTDQESGQIYRQSHATEIKQKKHDVHLANIDHIHERQKIWRAANAETLKARIKNYREVNAEMISRQKAEKKICECGAVVSHHYMVDHRKTRKHLALLLPAQTLAAPGIVSVSDDDQLDRA